MTSSWKRTLLILGILAGTSLISSGSPSQQDTGKLLEGLGYTTEVKKTTDGDDYWRFKAEGGKYNYSIDAIFSTDKRFLYLTIYFKDLSSEDKIPASAMLGLLKANDNNTPYAFGYVEKQKRFALTYPMDARDLNPAKMRKALTSIMALADANAPHWDPDLWGKNH